MGNVAVVEITDGDVDLARWLATRAHAGQVDKAGRSYIEHPERVARRCTTRLAKAVAWLHDVTEDTGTTAGDLLDEGVPEAVVRRVRLLDRGRTTDPLAYYADIADDPVALEVKAADIADNADPDRLALLPAETRERLEVKYGRARVLLGIYPDFRG